ncbi:hypothetical protein B0H14DRAFT_2589681 [Mycena olivaceomarginata]|nr:hypothetical protein B0H14DRAFT_2589681 [Mycena olivaceomarginata]
MSSKQRDRRILFAPTLTAATGFLHECPGFGPAFLQQHDGSFVRNPEVNIYFRGRLVPRQRVHQHLGIWGLLLAASADAEAAWMQYGRGGNIHAKVGSYWSAMEASFRPSLGGRYISDEVSAFSSVKHLVLGEKDEVSAFGSVKI